MILHFWCVLDLAWLAFAPGNHALQHDCVRLARLIEVASLTQESPNF